MPCGICGGPVDPSVRTSCVHGCGQVFHAGLLARAAGGAARGSGGLRSLRSAGGLTRYPGGPAARAWQRLAEVSETRSCEWTLLDGRLDADVLASAWHDVVAQHPLLAVRWERGAWRASVMAGLRR